MASIPERAVPSPSSWWRRTCRRLWKVMIVFWGTIIIGFAINITSSVLTSPMGTSFTHLIIVHWAMMYPLPPLIGVVGFLVLTVVSWAGSREGAVVSSLSPEQQNRLAILKALHKAYTEELDSSLQGITQIALGLHERFDLTHPRRLVSWHVGQPERELPAGTTVVDTYDQAGNGLLILGEPGAGKSTLLYNLAQALLTRAEQNENLCLPVILNLSSWSTKRLPLLEWLVEDLELRYLIPRALGRRWLEEGRLVPLLDGLDEIATAAQSDCIQAINAYHTAYVVPLVVCSRRDEYLAQSRQLTLQSAIIVQPLTVEQVKTYLKDGGRSLAAVRKVVQTNHVLQALLTTPLMLSVVTLAYKDKAVKDLPQIGSPEEQQRQIFASYLQHMLYAHGPLRFGTAEQLQHWLVWLAKQMQQRHLSVLYLEQLQPDWLPVGRLQQQYRWWGIYLPGALIGSLACLSINVLLFAFLNGWSLLLLGLLGGLIGGLIGRNQTISSSRNPSHYSGRMLAGLLSALLLGLGVGGLAGLIARAQPPLPAHLFPGYPILTGYYILSEVLFGSACMLLVLFLSRPWLPIPRRSRPTQQAKVAKKHLWSNPLISEALRPSLLIGGLCGLVYGLLAGLAYGLTGRISQELGGGPLPGLLFGSGGGLSNGLVAGLISGLITGLVFGLGSLLIRLILERASTDITPTEILVWSWKSLRHSLLQRVHRRNAFLVAFGPFLICLIVWLVFTPVFALVYIQGSRLLIGLIAGLIAGLIVGLIAGLIVGLITGGSYWLLVGLFQGISTANLLEEQRAVPNQGIQRSIRNGLLLGLISAGIGSLLGGLFITLIIAVPNELFRHVLVVGYGMSYGPLFGLAVGLLVVLLMGGLAWWRHWVLRILLWRDGNLSWHTVQMLDETTRHILLRKAGGGYRFIHDLFRDYLASSDTSPTASSTAWPSSDESKEPPLQVSLGESRNKPSKLHTILATIIVFLLIIAGILVAVRTIMINEAMLIAANHDPYQPRGTLALADPLSQTYEWTSGTNPSWGGQCQFINGAYQISQSKLQRNYVCDSNDMYSNFTFEVKMTINQGDCGGLGIRSNSDNSNDYFFEVCQNGTYSFYKYTSNSSSVSLKAGSSWAIIQGTGLMNLIAVVANGSRFDLYVNDFKINSTSDGAYDQGIIGLVADDQHKSTVVTYQDARIWTI